jgi:CubicO group peptidase (beta-lactamase class C family)
VTGDLWPAGGASHTGFTGTSLAFDRASGVWAVLLTNRVHFGRDRDLRGLRARFHNLVAAAVLGEAAAGGV